MSKPTTPTATVTNEAMDILVAAIDAATNATLHIRFDITGDRAWFDDRMPRDLADAILAAGWRPPTRTVSRETEIEALPVGSVLVDLDDDVIIQRTSTGEFGWQEPGSDERIDSSEIPRPQTVLHEGSKR